MTNGIEVGNYVAMNGLGAVHKVIAIQDHEKHYADLHLIFVDEGEICEVKLRADQVHKLKPETIEASIKHAMDAFPAHISQDEDFQASPLRSIQWSKQGNAEEFPETEDYPGQRREIAIHDAIKTIVNAADRKILEVSDGSCEETDYITWRVAEAFLAKVGQRAASAWQAKQLGLPRFPRKRTGYGEITSS